MNPHQPQKPSQHHDNAPGHDQAVDYVRQQVAQAFEDGSPYQQTYNQQQPQPQNLQEYHAAWQNYYQEYYRRYYEYHLGQMKQQIDDGKQPTEETEAAAAKPLTPAEEFRQRLLGTVKDRAKQARKSPHFKPLVTAVVIGFVFLFLQFNRTIIAQAKYYISPGTLTNEGSSIIINPDTMASVGQEPRIIIPKINVDVPVVYDETSYNENRIQAALERGVVHYGATAMPGQIGNNVIIGHSSNDLFDSGQYKFAFVLLDRLDNGDVFMLHHEGKRYIYKVYNKAVINPDDFSLINIQTDKPVVTLITCTPPGTALRRLVVQAEQISPSPDQNQVATQPVQTAELPATMPGNSPTLTERIRNIFN